MAVTEYQDIKKSLRQFYVEDKRPWLVGFSGGKDSAMPASLVFDVALSLPPGERSKPISFVCTDARVEIPAIVETVEGALENFGPFYGEHTLNFGNLDVRCGILVAGKTRAGRIHLLRAIYLVFVDEGGGKVLKHAAALAVAA